MTAPLASDADLAPAEEELIAAGVGLVEILEQYTEEAGRISPLRVIDRQTADDAVYRWTCAVVAVRAHVARRDWPRCQVCDAPVSDPDPNAHPDGPPILCEEHREPCTLGLADREVP